jgi:excisionase family DNA binding protein
MKQKVEVNKLLTVRQVAELMGWQEQTVYQKVHLREIEHIKLGRNIRFESKAIQKLIDLGRVPVLDSRT